MVILVIWPVVKTARPVRGFVVHGVDASCVSSPLLQFGGGERSDNIGESLQGTDICCQGSRRLLHLTLARAASLSHSSSEQVKI